MNVGSSYPKIRIKQRLINEVLLYNVEVTSTGEIEHMCGLSLICPTQTKLIWVETFGRNMSPRAYQLPACTMPSSLFEFHMSPAGMLS